MEINPNNRNIPASDEGQHFPSGAPRGSSRIFCGRSQRIGRHRKKCRLSRAGRIGGKAYSGNGTARGPNRSRISPHKGDSLAKPRTQTADVRRAEPAPHGTAAERRTRGAGAAHRSGGAVRASDHGRKCKTNRAAQHASACGGSRGKRKSRCRAAFRISGKTRAGSGREKRKRRAPQHSPGFGER